MPDIISSLTAGGISGIGDAFQKIYSTFKLTAEQKATIDQAVEANKEHIADLDAQYKIKVLDTDAAENETAGKNIRAEASSGDKFVERARPAVIWGGLGIIFWNYCLVPTFGHHWSLSPAILPDLFWEIWGIVCTGYVFARTADKITGGAGGSIQLPFGLKIDSKGDK